MNREVSASQSNDRFQTTVQLPVETAMEMPQPDLHAENATQTALEASLLSQASQLNATAKVGLIRQLMTQLEPTHLQEIVEVGLREIGSRPRRGNASSTSSLPHTRLVLKKDYSFQERGLSEPTQYYVYLRRRKPKLDRYIGALFYVPQGCTLSYGLDAKACIVFNSPNNIFLLRDCTNSAITQVVRLICLEPPPADYTFSKQQNDTPEIYLHLEQLDPHTWQPTATAAYPFPTCMHEGGQLDRYRWDTSIAIPPAPHQAP